MKKESIKVPFYMDLLMIIASIASWPLCFVICYFFNDEKDKRKVVLLDHLRINAIVVFSIELILLVIRFIFGIISGFNSAI